MLRVLIADDDPVARQLVSSLLAKWGYAVIAVNDGAAAQLELSKQSAPTLAILDWMMPGLDGIAVIRDLRAKRHAEYTYVLLLSAKNEMKDILDGLRAGADDYLTKPIDARQLKARLVIAERILDLQHRMGSALEVSQGELLPVLASMRRPR
jgi:sigma-B regulation protein RsbU (phosphoserine phosphatase)